VKEITDEDILYTIRKSTRAKHLRLVISCSGKVSVVVPVKNFWQKETSSKLIKELIEKKAGWIKKTLARFSTLPQWQKRIYTKKDFLVNKEMARELISRRLNYFNQFYGLKWNRISIRDQKSRWGSCSRKGNLNFNYKLLFLPAKLQDYVVAHELCHLQEMNHSQKFWDLVAKTLPDFKNLRRELKGGLQ